MSTNSNVFDKQKLCEYLDIKQPAFLLAPDGNTLDCNDSFLQLFNITKTDLIDEDFFTFCKKNNIDSPFGSLSELQKLKEATTIVHNKNIRWSGSKIKSGIYKGALFIIGFDITTYYSASSKDENIIKTIIDQLPNHYVFWKDINSVYLGCNQQLASKLGLKSSSEIIGKTDYDLPTKKEQSDAYRKDDKSVMDSGKPYLNIEEPQTLPDGTTRILSTSKAPLFDEQKNVYGVLAIYSDITERKNLENSLEKAKNEAEAASRAKSEFISRMSHDIRTPLSGIIGLGAMIQKNIEKNQFSTEQLLHFSKSIQKSGYELLQFLTKILEDVYEGKIFASDITLKSFDLHDCLSRLVDLEYSSALSQNLYLKLNIDTKVPRFVVCDYDKFFRVIENLLGNSIKYTETGGVTLDVECTRTTQKKAYLTFIVKDTGMGIKKVLQKKVFQKNYRANPHEKKGYKGFGRGLYDVQLYIKRLGGKIELESKLGVGTTFYVYIPMLIANAQSRIDIEAVTLEKRPAVKEDVFFTPPNKQTTKANACLNYQEQDKPKVLLVEDDEVLTTISEEFLKEAGCLYKAVMSGEAALECVLKESFDLIITDIGLPGISGIEFVEQFRAWEKAQKKNQTPVLGLSAEAMDVSFFSRCKKAGMNDLYLKPLSSKKMDDILSHINKQPLSVSEKPTSQNTSKNNLGAHLPDTEEELFKIDQFPLFDSEEALKIINDPQIFIEGLEALVVSIPERIKELQELHKQKNWDKIAKLAHTIKGGSLYYGTIRLSQTSQYLERYQTCGHKKYLDKLLYQLIIVAEDTKKCLDDWIASYRN